MKSLGVLLVLVAFAGIHGVPNDFASRNLDSVLDGVGDALQCNELREACSGVIPCCDELQCYWENGYELFSDGVCVECVGEGKKCQRDNQCCEGLQCDNSGVIDFQGECLPPRAEGEVCYEDNQCASGDCSRKWYQLRGNCN